MAQLSVMTELAKYGPAAPTRSRPPHADAQAYCRDFARRHYENFSIASRLLPVRLLPHFYSIYAYCRWADDLADETRSCDESLQLLDWWQDQLERCYAGLPEHPVFVALAETIEAFSIPQEPFRQLLDAFRQDQRVRRYATHRDVLGYCANSANPVGRLVLHVGRCHDARNIELSDSICTGLQLANFCQDVARDWDRGRVYLPQETLGRHGVTNETFINRRATGAFRAALAEEVERAWEYLDRGRPLVELVGPELRLQVALFIGGGVSILRTIRKRDFDVWSARPTISRWQQLMLLGQCWWSTRRR